MIVGPFNLSGWRRVALTVAMLVALFSGFFWLGYWTGVGRTLTRQRVAVPTLERNDASRKEPPKSREKQTGEAVKL